MKIEIIDEPIRFRLHGKWSVVENHCYGEVRFAIDGRNVEGGQDAKTQTTGINHWSTMADERMFVGVRSRTLNRLQFRSVGAI